MNSREYATHIQILGWLFVLGNAILFALGLLALFFFPAIGFAINEPIVVRILGAIGLSGAALFTALALPGLIAGYGLLTRRPWARVLGLVWGFLGLANFPVGTAIGAYAFWVLMQPDMEEYFTPLKRI